MKKLLIAFVILAMATFAGATPPAYNTPTHAGSGGEWNFLGFLSDNSAVMFFGKGPNPELIASAEYRAGRYAPITVDSTSSADTTSATSLEWAHTTDAAANLLCVMVWASDNVATGATYNAVAMTARYSNTAEHQVWCIKDPAAGANDITVSFGANEQGKTMGIAASLFNVDEIAAVSSLATGASESSSTVVSSVGYDTILDFLHIAVENPDTPTPAGDQTLAIAHNTSPPPGGIGYIAMSSRNPAMKLPDTETHMTWSWTGSQTWSASAIALRPVITWVDETDPDGWTNWPSPYGAAQISFAETDDSYWMSVKATDRFAVEKFDELMVAYALIARMLENNTTIRTLEDNTTERILQ